MALSDKIVEKLVCPNCKCKLIYDEDKSILICNECNVTYRINNDVPVLLADEAQKM